MATKSGRTRNDLPEHRRRIYQQDACHDYDTWIEQAAALPAGRCLVLTRWPDGTPIADEADAWQLLNRIKDCKAGRQYTIRRGQPAGLGPRQRPLGGAVRRPPKSAGRDHIARLIDAGGIPAFNPAQRKARGKYICPRAIGGCGHRHSRAPGQLCDDCAQQRADQASRQAAAEERQRRDLLARRQFGEGWDDHLNWLTDHAPPRTPREHADRPLAEQARQLTGLEERERRRAGIAFPWEERRPGRPGQDILSRTHSMLRESRQALADRIEISQITDPRMREMLERWRTGR
jgi:hypothetical protein